MFFASLIFSFFSSSLHLGFTTNILKIKTNAVNMYVSAPLTPNLILLPIIAKSTTPNNGTEFTIQAPKILMLNGENSPVIPTIDIISDII